MKLEGRLVGPYVMECEKMWLAIGPSLGAKAIKLDVSGVSFIDEAGLQFLKKMYQATQAEILSNSPLTEHFAAQISKSIAVEDKGVTP